MPSIAVELLENNGFDGLAGSVTVKLNSAMVAGRSEYLEQHWLKGKYQMARVSA